MENILVNFDEHSKTVIKELVKDNDKMTGLIAKLSGARDIMNNKAELAKAMHQETKK